MVETPPETWRTRIVSTRPGTPRHDLRRDVDLPQGAAALVPADQRTLHGVARALAGDAGNPRDGRLGEAPPAPPIGIAPSGVRRLLEGAGERLAELIAGEEETLAMREPG